MMDVNTCLTKSSAACDDYMLQYCKLNPSSEHCACYADIVCPMMSLSACRDNEQAYRPAEWDANGYTKICNEKPVCINTIDPGVGTMQNVIQSCGDGTAPVISIKTQIQEYFAAHKSQMTTLIIFIIAILLLVALSAAPFVVPPTP